MKNLGHSYMRKGIAAIAREFLAPKREIFGIKNCSKTLLGLVEAVWLL